MVSFLGHATLVVRPQSTSHPPHPPPLKSWRYFTILSSPQSPELSYMTDSHKIVHHYCQFIDFICVPKMSYREKSQQRKSASMNIAC